MNPLDGIRVLDMSRLLPGPMCTWYLQGMGAEVIKVEDPAGGDYLRHMPPHRSDGFNAWFAAINAGKQSVALNLRRPSHQAALEALIAQADVLVESFRPGVMARLGMAPEALRDRYPRLVICSITGFGQDGPMAHLPGHDLGYMALGGLLSLGSRVDGLPEVPGVQLADIAGGALTAAMRISAALVGRASTGKGAWLDVSMTEAAMALLAPAVAQMAVEGRAPTPGAEPLTGGFAQYKLYRCSDGGVIAVAPLEPKFWGALCAAVGEELDPSEERLTALFRTRTRDEWADALGGACVNAMLELDELASHPLHQQRGTFTGEGENLRVVPPVECLPERATQPAPGLGEHTEAALRAVGYDPVQLEEGT